MGKIEKSNSRHRRISKVLASITAVALAAMNVPFGSVVFAVGDNGAVSAEAVYSCDSGETNDELLEAYIDHYIMADSQFGLYQFRPTADSYLTEDEKVVYDFLKGEIKKVAAGTLASTEFKIDDVSISYTGNPDDAVNAKYNLSKILDCLLNDCPYELYWYDKTVGTLMSYSYTSDTIKSISYKFTVASEYKTSTYVADTTKTSAVFSAINNINTIKSTYASKTDLEKLQGYKNEICTLVSYNDDAANNNTTPYGNPWQLIWVFDGDANTKVVCEGYSKAFKYLCDLTDFSEDIYCYTVTGTMDGGDHMWNIVEIGDKTYHVDVTNCDEGTVGYPDLLFLKGVTGPTASGFTIESINYLYDEDTKAVYSTEIGKLSTADYTPAVTKTLDSIAIKTQPSDKEYTIGEAFDPTGLVITATYSEGEPEDITYSTTNASDFSFSPATFTTAGTNQTVTVTYKGKTATIDGITVNKKTPAASDFTFTAPANTDYDGTAKTATVSAKTGITGMGIVSVKYYKEDVETEPKAKGTYKVKIEVAEGTNYSATTTELTDDSWTFTIGGASISGATVTVEGAPFTYTGSAIEPTVKVELGSKTLTKGVDYTVSYEDNTDAGTSAKVTVTGTGNYTGTASATFTIGKATPTITGVSVSSPATVYTSTAPSTVTLTCTAKLGETTVLGNIALDGVTAFTEGTSNYNWKFTPSNTDNFNSTTGTVPITVTADTIDSIAITTDPTKTTYTAGDKFAPAGLKITATYLSGATKPVTYDNTTKSAFSFEPSLETALKTTDTTVTVTYTENGVAKSNTVAITVGKATPTVDAPTGLTATYGKTLADVTLPTVTGGTWAWKDSTSTSVGNVGTKTFKATYTPDDLDYSSVDKDVTVTVSPASLTVSATAVDKDYDKTTTAEASVSFTGLVNSETLDKDVDYTVSAAFDDANAGTGKTVTVTVTLLNTDKAKNYTLASGTTTATANINKINPNVTKPSVLSITYTGDTAPTLGDVTLPAGWVWSEGDATSLTEGSSDHEATYTPADTTNYNTLIATVTVKAIKTECDHVGKITTTTSPESPNCGDTVTETKECTECGWTDTITYVKEHAWNSSFTIDTPATCTTPGEKSIHCANCSATKDVTAIPALGHTGGTATCTDAAICSVCGVSYGAPLGHLPSEAYSFDSESHWHECTRCSEKLDLADHISDGGVVTKPATATETGVKTYSCTVCKNTIKTEIIPATGGGSDPAPVIPSSPSYSNPSNSSSSSSVSKQPEIKGENGKTGWTAIAEVIANSSENGSVTIDMNGTSTLPKKILEEAADNKIDLVIETGNGIKWTIYGESITNAKDINLDVTKGTDNIPDNVISTVSYGEPVVQLSLAHNGKFGFDAVMSITLGKKYDGSYANLYYYNKKTKEMELTDCSEILNGKTDLMFNHASEWAIVISDKPAMDFEDVGAGAGIYEKSENIDISTAMSPVIFVISAAAAAVLMVIVHRKKAGK